MAEDLFKHSSKIDPSYDVFTDIKAFFLLISTGKSASSDNEAVSSSVFGTFCSKICQKSLGFRNGGAN